MDKVEWSEWRFRIFDIEGNLMAKSERTTRGSFEVCRQRSQRGCFLAFGLVYRGDLILSHQTGDGQVVLANWQQLFCL